MRYLCICMVVTIGNYSQGSNLNLQNSLLLRSEYQWDLIRIIGF